MRMGVPKYGAQVEYRPRCQRRRILAAVPAKAYRSAVRVISTHALEAYAVAAPKAVIHQLL